MATVRGQSGYCALTGALFGVPVVQTLVPLGASLMSVVGQAGGPLTGTISYGQTFTVSGVAGTYTVIDPVPPTSGALGYRKAVADTVALVSFTPPAVAAFPATAVVTFDTVFFANVRRWQLSRTLVALDTTVMRQPARTFRGGHISFTGVAEGLFDYGDAGQQALVDALVTTRTGLIPFLALGSVEILTYDNFLLAASVLVTDAVLTEQRDGLATVVFSFRGKDTEGPVTYTYTAAWEAPFVWPGIGAVVEYYTGAWES